MSKRIKYIIALLLFFTCNKIIAQPLNSNSRIVINEDLHWQFVKDSANSLNEINYNNAKWQPVNLPHTWNVTDVMDDIPGYYRGIGWYKKTIAIGKTLKNKKLFLYFEGANQQTEVFINGKRAGSHIGGYTAFCVPVNEFLKTTDFIATVLVKVDNSFNENIPPLTADFTFYGGIYRNVSLIATDATHFSLDDNASSGVYISTPDVSMESATVHIKGNFMNTSLSIKKVQVTTIISTDRKEKVIVIKTFVDAVASGAAIAFEQASSILKKPHLWSPEAPYLYTATTTITDAASGARLDQVINKIGFRWFRFDADSGFFLNGKSYKLIGASRHQDRKRLGNAVSKRLAIEDMLLIKNAGMNFCRIAHYPQDQAVLNACDSLGILTSVEIPIVNEITESENFYQNCGNMQLEMIRQNYGHPSIIIWCYMNEIFLRPHFSNDKERQNIYYASIEKLARSLDSITRKEDPYRYTMITNHGDFNRYNDHHITTIPMLTGWNLYSGWYGPKLEDLPLFLDKHHEKLPNQPFLITEYGADADSRIRSNAPVRFDKSVEYATKFHQYYIREIMKLPFVSGAVVWNLADFNSETRNESMPHINTKGLLTWDRIPKDDYYLYQAAFSKAPVVKLASRYWKIRSGVADSMGAYCYQRLQAASNLQTLDLKLNGKEIGNADVINDLATWNVPFVNGINKITVSGNKNGKQYSDTMTVRFSLQPFRFSDSRIAFEQLNILLGTTNSFFDKSIQQVWIPDKYYSAGSWGHIGGNSFVLGKKSPLPFGTDKNITGTENDPIYQTQLEGIQQYKFDVPDGKYELTLHFAELYGGTVKQLAYNLTDSSRSEKNAKRIFSVTINDIPFLENFNIADEYGIAKAVSKKITVVIKNKAGISINFTAVEGEPILNTIQIKKLGQ